MEAFGNRDLMNDFKTVGSGCLPAKIMVQGTAESILYPLCQQYVGGCFVMTYRKTANTTEEIYTFINEPPRPPIKLH